MLMQLSNNIKFDENIINNFENTLTPNLKYHKLLYINFPINETINFIDDVWIFSTYDSLDRESSIYKFSFFNIPLNYKFYLKILILEILILDEYAITTAQSFFRICKNFINFLSENKILNPVLIDLDIVKNYFIQFENTTESNKVTKKRYIAQFLQEIECKESVFYKEIYDFLNIKDLLLLSAQRENGKTKIIPRKTYNKIVSLAIKDIHNKNLSKNFKKISCMVLILCETGMRIGEFVRIERNKLKSIDISDNRTVHYLEFKTYKTSNCKDFKWTECFATDKLVLAYNTLLKLNSNYPSCKYIYTSNTNEKNKVSENTCANQLLKFFALHQDELGFSELSKYDLSLAKNKRITKETKRVLGEELSNNLLNKDSLYYFHSHQFRVTICTQLYNQGVDLEWIRFHMNHLSADMTLHYIRMNKLHQKEKLLADTLMSRMSDDGSFLETDTSKVDNKDIIKELENPELKGYYNDINKFLEKNKFNIKKDLNEIIETLTRFDIPLMEMEYGYCAQHALSRICSRQEYISSLTDSYHLKPQLPNLKYLDFTYRRFCEKSKIIKYNKKISNKNNKYSLEYEREKKALKNFINNRLVPELNLALDEITKIGLTSFIELYPNLKDIAKRINVILKKEVLLWIQ